MKKEKKEKPKYSMVQNLKFLMKMAWKLEKDTAEYTHTMGYVTDVIFENNIGKDIRLFGLGNWLQDIYDSAMNLYRGFVTKREKKYLVADMGV